MRKKKHIGDIIITYWDDYFYSNFDEREKIMKLLPILNFGGVEHLQFNNAIEVDLKLKKKTQPVVFLWVELSYTLLE